MINANGYQVLNLIGFQVLVTNTFSMASFLSLIYANYSLTSCNFLLCAAFQVIASCRRKLNARGHELEGWDSCFNNSCSLFSSFIEFHVYVQTDVDI